MTLLFFYTDPGSGAMLLQLLLATIAGAGFYFRSFFYRLFGGKKTASVEVVDENDSKAGK
jgi:hypothetical protein